MPRIAVITPVYATPENQRLVLLEDTIKSMHRLQDDFVHLIVDDGSPFNVRDLVMSYNSLDPRIRYLRRERQKSDLCTASNALNYGINQVLDSEEYKDIEAITTLHSDDLMLDLEIRLRAIEEGACASTGYELRFDNNGYAKLKRGFSILPLYMISDGNSEGLNTHTFMWRRDLAVFMRRFNLENHNIDGLFMPNIRYAEDRAVAKLTILAVHLSNGLIDHVNIPCVAYRLHTNSITGDISYEDRGKDRQIVDSAYYLTTKKRSKGRISEFLFYFNKPLANPLRKLRTLVFGCKDLQIIQELQKELDSIKTPNQISTSLICS